MAVSGIASSFPQARPSLRPALKELRQDMKEKSANFRQLQKDVKAGDWTAVDNDVASLSERHQEIKQDRTILQELRGDLLEYQRNVRQLYQASKAGNVEAAKAAQQEVEAVMKEFHDDMNKILPSPSEPAPEAQSGVNVVA